MPLRIKVCSVCDRVQKYDKGDRLPHWAILSEGEWAAVMRMGYCEHHTLCDECRKKAHNEVKKA